jgi:1-deoxy-D-xylulose-5-phosphate reductoisomerase
MKKKIAILGSTGSIGKTLFKILKNDKTNFDIRLLAADKNIKELLKQVKIFKVKNIIVTNPKKFLQLKKILKNKKINIFNDFKCFSKIFKNKKIDYTMNSLSGLNGLKPTLDIIKFTKYIAIANKESIICGWSLIKNELKKNKTEFIPIDSEHFSIWSLTKNIKNENIDKIYITASGGPFLSLPLNKFKSINSKSALNHPNWKMGKKISIDSATMMNKVFEIIEAKKIFNLNYNKIKILIHPKSYVHAIIKFHNGLSKILIHDTNMIIPIFNSVYPNFVKKIKSKQLDIEILNNLSFNEIDKKRFPITKVLKCLPNNDTLYETVLVAVNDKLVEMFLDKKIKFIDISKFLLRIINLKEFIRYKKIKAKKVSEIENLRDYVSLKVATKCV